MDSKKEAFRKRLLATFQEEAAEHIRVLSSGLIELEKSSAAESHPQTLEAIFREAHSLKGAARAVNVAAVETICQSLENVFSSWQRKETAPSQALFDILHRATDSLEKILLSLDTADDSTQAGRRQFDTAPLIASLERARQGSSRKTRPEQEPAVPDKAIQSSDAGGLPVETRSTPADTVRLPAARLGSLLVEAEELLSAKLAARQRVAEAEQLQAALVPWKKARSSQRSLLRSLSASPETTGHRAGHENGKGYAQIQKLLAFQDQDDHFFQSLENQLESLTKTEHRDHRSLERMVDQLLDDAKKLVMLPAASLLATFPKLARDLARDRGKLVVLEVLGADLEVDRRILEEMKEPLLHLVRNSVDHGVEAPADRLRANKPEQGVLRIVLHRMDSDKVEFVVSDDGRGIQVASVQTAALKLGIVSPEEAQPPEERDQQKALDLIFRSGVSTSPIITDISGRGLGLAIVREKVEKLGGAVSIENFPGLGTKFRMIVPLTRSALRGVVVRVDEQLFVFPSVQVERVMRFEEEDIKTVENRDTLVVEGRATALVRLSDALGLPVRKAAGGNATGRQAVVLASADQHIAIRVDEVLDEQEVLAKPLGKQLARVRNIAGATVLPSGRVVPILDVVDLFKSAAEANTVAQPSSPPAQEAERTRKSILVAEDSITARSLLKNILETAGYNVQTAVDGAEAFAALKMADFDLLVSDVDMPRLNGFGLTQKIRSDPKLAGLPVILVTALGSREDRERGIDAGANAYIVKSSFDESDLLEVLGRLV
jgi:two-component system chemotaxis sensor kinase CheA